MTLPSVLRRASLLVAAALFLAPLPQARAASTTVEARDNYFATKYIVITVGDEITWTNAGANKHTVRSFDGVPEGFRSSPNSDPSGTGACKGGVLVPDDCMRSGDTFRFTFNTPGTYAYYCEVHGDPSKRPNASLAANTQPCGMCAQIVVRTVASSPPPVTVRTRPARPSTKASASPSTSATPSLIPTTGGSPIAAPSSGGGGSGGRATLAVLVILALSGAGYATWRTFLAPR